MFKRLDLSQKITCNTVAKTFSLAAETIPCYEITFCKKWLISDLCSSIQQSDETIICQSKSYLCKEFIKNNEIPLHEDYKMDKEVMYWMGYLLTYWMYSTGINGAEIVSRFNIKSILERYDTLHTTSMQVAIETIESECSQAKIILDNILYAN